jgi:hypothetical protein
VVSIEVAPEPITPKGESAMNSIASVLGSAALLGVMLAPAARADEITVTGCLAKSPQEGEFELTHASGGDAEAYALTAGEGIDFGPHVGHKVELAGRLEAKAEGKSDEEGTKAADAALKVSSMKHLAAGCP